MSRNLDDIPEAFRRFLEEDGLDQDGDDGGSERPIKSAGPPGRPWWTNRTLWLVVIGMIFLASLGWIVSTYTEWLWFTEIGYRDIWLKAFTVQVISFVIFMIVATAVMLGNWLYAHKQALRTAIQPGRQLLNIPGLRWIVSAAALFLGYLFAVTGASRWDSLLRYFYRTPFDLEDPIFNLDVSFYIFELPVYRFLQSWLSPLFIFALIGVVALYAVGSLPDVQRGRWRPWQMDGFRKHFTVLGAIVLLLWAGGYALSIYELNYSPRGVVVGASYTDIKAQMPALYSQLAITLLLAVALLYNYFRPDWRPIAIMAGLWLAVTILLGGVYPSLIQRYEVEPNELNREREFIDYNIAMTRFAFGLDQVESRDFDVVTELSEQDLTENEAIVKNIRLWDYRPLQQTYSQLQELRPYYEFGELDIDRYEIDGELEQVMLGARELNKDNLPSQTWVNQKLEFTHGYGVVMNPVNQITAEGRPEFYIQDLPPSSSVGIDVDRPEVYYGEIVDDVVYVGSDFDEFSYPSGEQNVYSNYDGAGGVALSSFLRRVAFAIRFGDINVLLSEAITDDTRVLFHRQIRERINLIAPFLTLDRDPYMVIADGRMVWMVDAYTASSRFPYSTPAPDGFNYIRNSVKITVDAYDGTVIFYLADPDDPIIQSYAAAFPNVFQPLENMPQSLQEHIRYPESLFLAQTEQFLIYHMTEAQEFYNKEDLWEIPQEIFDSNQQPIEPYYVISKMPGEDEIEYLLIQPYTPASKNNMVSWIAARSDPPHYGELVAYELPRQELVFGPIQIEGRIDQDPQISQQISLWNQRGSRVIRGNLLVLPVNNSFLYVEPLYLLSDTSALPELKRVIVASGDRVAMRPTLDMALNALVFNLATVDSIDVDLGSLDSDLSADSEEEQAGDSTIPVDSGDIENPTVEEIITSANFHFENAEAAQRVGDWATYGQELELLNRDLERLLELTGAEP